MHNAFSPRLDNALLSHGAGTENNTEEWEKQGKKGKKNIEQGMSNVKVKVVGNMTPPTGGE